MMRCSCRSTLRDRLLLPWLLDYDRLQRLAVVLIYVQIGCALVGSLGALYGGVQLINLSISLFALVAIESSSQSLGRTYALLLFFAILVDVAWFVLFARDVWNISSETYGSLFVFSVKLAFAMQILGFFVRVLSSFVWVQIYRLGVSQEADFDLRNSFLDPTTPDSIRQSSCSEDATGGSIYDPAYYASLFEYTRESGVAVLDQKDRLVDDECINCFADDDSGSFPAIDTGRLASVSAEPFDEDSTTKT